MAACSLEALGAYLSVLWVTGFQDLYGKEENKAAMRSPRTEDHRLAPDARLSQRGRA